MKLKKTRHKGVVWYRLFNASFRRTPSWRRFPAKSDNCRKEPFMAKKSSPPGAESESTNWRELYRDAILELNPSKLPQHIVEAERALIERGRELVQEAGDNSEEERALEDATYFLRALRRIEVQPEQSCPQFTRLSDVKVA